MLTGSLWNPQLRDVWLGEITKNASTPVTLAAARAQDTLPPPTARIEVMGYLSRATLDIIGKAGFNYDFNALHPISKVHFPAASNTVTKVVTNANCPQQR